MKSIILYETIILVLILTVYCDHEEIDDQIIAAIDDKIKSKMCDPNVITDSIAERLEKCEEMYHKKLEIEFDKLGHLEEQCDNHTDTFMDKYTKLNDQHYRHHLSDVCNGQHTKCHAQMKQQIQDIVTKTKNTLNTYSYVGYK
ncbi:unnamed protein product [Oppiella nova]|uniref:Uncharacterized protein n=1 Tax=Oppiella nova TaxID=334625 RepID=A0A7R9M4J6_9ACAR|nr:unnamed protein product [Oppiella nova]CAG2170394.1 unnamed protein product [Oppiella nova]